MPIVIGWLLVPVCGRKKLITAIAKANNLAYVATPGTEEPHDDDIAPASDPVLARQDLTNLQLCGWVEVVEDVVGAFEHAAQRSWHHVAVRPKAPWIEADKWGEIHPDNRIRSVHQVQAYYGLPLLDVEYTRPMWRKGRPHSDGHRVPFCTRVAMGDHGICDFDSALHSDRWVGVSIWSVYSLWNHLDLVWIMLITSSILNHCYAAHSPSSSPARRSMIASCRIFDPSPILLASATVPTRCGSSSFAYSSLQTILILQLERDRTGS